MLNENHVLYVFKEYFSLRILLITITMHMNRKTLVFSVMSNPVLNSFFSQSVVSSDHSFRIWRNLVGRNLQGNLIVRINLHSVFKTSTICYFLLRCHRKWLRRHFPEITIIINDTERHWWENGAVMSGKIHLFYPESIEAYHNWHYSVYLFIYQEVKDINQVQNDRFPWRSQCSVRLLSLDQRHHTTSPTTSL